MRILAIINPVSGRFNMAAVLRRVVERVTEAGQQMTVCLTRCAGDAARLAGDAPEDTRGILVGGGDGTVREVIDGLIAAKRSIPMAIMPTGTANIVSRQFGQSANPERIADNLLHGKPVSGDVGILNGKHFILVAGVGFDAEVVRRLVAGRAGHIEYMDYFWPIWRTFFAHEFPTIRVHADGDEVFAGQGFAMASVIPRYTAGLRVLKNAVPDDGMVDLCVYPCNSRRGLLRHIIETASQTHDRSGRAIYRKCEQIRIEGVGEVPLEVDGDPGGELPAVCSVLPSAVTFLMPAF